MVMMSLQVISDETPVSLSQQIRGVLHKRLQAPKHFDQCASDRERLCMRALPVRLRCLDARAHGASYGGYLSQPWTCSRSASEIIPAACFRRRVLTK